MIWIDFILHTYRIVQNAHKTWELVQFTAMQGDVDCISAIRTLDTIVNTAFFESVTSKTVFLNVDVCGNLVELIFTIF